MFRMLFMMLAIGSLYVWFVSSGSKKDLVAKGEEIFRFAKKKWKKMDIDWEVTKR
jgi:hypothetical protein